VVSFTAATQISALDKFMEQHFVLESEASKWHRQRRSFTFSHFVLSIAHFEHFQSLAVYRNRADLLRYFGALAENVTAELAVAVAQSYYIVCTDEVFPCGYKAMLNDQGVGDALASLNSVDQTLGLLQATLLGWLEVRDCSGYAAWIRDLHRTWDTLLGNDGNSRDAGKALVRDSSLAATA
jgi:hypothetical protein